MANTTNSGIGNTLVMEQKFLLTCLSTYIKTRMYYGIEDMDTSNDIINDNASINHLYNKLLKDVIIKLY